MARHKKLYIKKRHGLLYIFLKFTLRGVLVLVFFYPKWIGHYGVLQVMSVSFVMEAGGHPRTENPRMRHRSNGTHYVPGTP